MDLSQISTEDLKALQSGDLSKVSTEGLQKLRGTPAAPPAAEKPPPGYEDNPATGYHYRPNTLADNPITRSPIYGVLEAGGSSVMNMLGKIVSGYHGLLTLGTDGADKAADTVNADRAALHTEASSPGAKDVQAALGTVAKPFQAAAAPIDKAIANASPGVRTAVPAASEAIQDIAGILPIGAAGRAGRAAEAAAAEAGGKVTGGSAIENGRGMGFKFAPSDVASRAPADAIEGGIPGMKREGLAGSPEVRKEATLHNTATATKEAGKFIGAGENVKALTPDMFDKAQQPHYDVYRETGETIGAGKTGSADFQQALADHLADQRPQTALAPKVARVAQQNIQRATSGNLSGPLMVKDISWLRANGGTKVANALEDEMERQLASSGGKSGITPGDDYIQGAGQLTDQAQKFKDARRSIAQIRTIQDNTTGGQLNLQGLRKVHEDTNGKLLTGPLKVMAEAAAAAPGSMRLPLGGVGSTVKGKTLFEAGKNAAAKVAQKVVPGLNPLGDAVQNQLGREAGATGRSYLNTAGERVKPSEALTLKQPPGKVSAPEQHGMDLPQGNGPKQLGFPGNWTASPGAGGTGTPRGEGIPLADVLSHGVEQPAESGLTLAPMGAPAAEGIPFRADPAHLAGDLRLVDEVPNGAGVRHADLGSVMSQGVPEGVTSRTAPEAKLRSKDTVPYRPDVIKLGHEMAGKHKAKKRGKD